MISEKSLRDLYASWPAHELAAALAARGDYDERAVGYMLDELKNRGLSESAIPEIIAKDQAQASPLPARPDTPFRPSKLGRKRYLIRWLIWLAVFLLCGLLSASIASPLSDILFAVGIVSVLYKIIGIDLPRVRDIGWSPWCLLALLIPGVNILFMGFLFFAPSE
jgi:hypothetical protein